MMRLPTASPWLFKACFTKYSTVTQVLQLRIWPNHLVGIAMTPSCNMMFRSLTECYVRNWKTKWRYVNLLDSYLEVIDFLPINVRYSCLCRSIQQLTFDLTLGWILHDTVNYLSFLDYLQGTAVEGTIQQLFEGHHMNYIECINVDYKSTRKESFYGMFIKILDMEE